MHKKLLGAATVLALVLAGCATAANTSKESTSTSQATQSDTIKIGGNFEQTGGAASYGQSMLDALNLAVKKKNAEGGVLGKQLEVVSYDNKSDAKESASVATRLATEANVVGIVGPATTGDANAQTPAVTKAKVPAILPAATGDNVTRDSNGATLDYVFRVVFTDSFQGGVLAQFATEELKATKAVILKDNATDYAKGLSDVFKEKYSGTIVAEENFATKDTDFQAVLTKLKTLDYDVIMIAGYYDEAGLIIKQAREMGITQPILGPDGFASPTLVELAGAENVTSVYYANHFTSQSEDAQVQEFLKAYKEEYGKEPDAFAALAYDAASVLFAAIEKAGSADRESVTKALSETANYDGVTGEFSLDESHSPVKSAYIIHLEKGEEVGHVVVKP